MSNQSKKALQIRDKTIFDGFIFKNLFKVIYLIWFKLSGWRPIAKQPDGAGVTIAAPHTSNWDIFYALGAAIIYDIKIYFSIKDSWCRLPVMGRFILWLGAIPISRDKGAGGQVALIKDFVERHRGTRIFFLFTPEGTRGNVTRWRTGFYHVAQDTGLPIFLAKVDYRTKECGVFHTFVLSGNKEQDIANIHQSYKSVCARYSHKQYPEYTGPRPEISALEASILKAMYALNDLATPKEISALAKIEEITQEMLDFLVEKGVLARYEREENNKTVIRYKITVLGSGCLFHLVPTLA